MNVIERRRIENLNTPCAEEAFLKELYGVPVPFDDRLNNDFRIWKSTTKVAECPAGRVNRYAFESFLESQRLSPLNAAAARFGMNPESLERLLPLLPKVGLSKKYAVYDGVIDDTLKEDLIRSLPGLRFRTFGTYDAFCELLHDALREACGATIEPLYCETARRIGEQRRFAALRDDVTNLPLSIVHAVRMNFGKPVSQNPDFCSKLFLAENIEELRPFLSGRREPRDMNDYQDFVRRSA
ncbi:MAG: hypothetical protein ACRC1K_06265 [Planctomycetia bacterium]